LATWLCSRELAPFNNNLISGFAAVCKSVFARYVALLSGRYKEAPEEIPPAVGMTSHIT
jgi:hypothetical protein